MLTHVRRAMIGVLVLAAAGVAQAQVLVETFAGGRTVDNLPSIEAPVTTGAMLTTVDGTVYVVDTMRNRLMRRDPATSMLTLFPSSTVVPPWNAVHNIFRGGSNYYLYAGGALYQLFLPDGQIQLITRLDFGTTACTQVSTDTQFAADSEWKHLLHRHGPQQRVQGARVQFHPAYRGRRHRGIRRRRRTGRIRAFQQPVWHRRRLRKQRPHR